mmetsp:Transcript_53535/g.126672  ORF Transcript_53535/g.126672 Transcript_53535/m.126672 type:complete len:233 (-) Transcript_53535:348-1046(-)
MRARKHLEGHPGALELHFLQECRIEERRWVRRVGAERKLVELLRLVEVARRGVVEQRERGKTGRVRGPQRERLFERFLSGAHSLVADLVELSEIAEGGDVLRIDRERVRVELLGAAEVPAALAHKRRQRTQRLWVARVVLQRAVDEPLRLGIVPPRVLEKARVPTERLHVGGGDAQRSSEEALGTRRRETRLVAQRDRQPHRGLHLGVAEHHPLTTRSQLSVRQRVLEVLLR